MKYTYSDIGNILTIQDEFMGQTPILTHVQIYRPQFAQGSSEPLFILGDHLGSTSVIANYNGSEHGAAGYKAWGETRFITGEVPTDYRFTGQKEHAALGLYFYNARWYDPQLGRFVQADTVVPVQQQGVQAFDRYGYVNNNPTNFTDSSGNNKDCAIGESGCTYIYKHKCNPLTEECKKEELIALMGQMWGWTFLGSFSYQEILAIFAVGLALLSFLVAFFHNCIIRGKAHSDSGVSRTPIPGHAAQ